jgi:hypothetical protein
MIYHVRVDLHDSQAAARLAAALQSVGLVTFEGVTDRASLLRLAGQVMHIWHPATATQTASPPSTIEAGWLADPDRPASAAMS